MLKPTVLKLEFADLVALIRNRPLDFPPKVLAQAVELCFELLLDDEIEALAEYLRVECASIVGVPDADLNPEQLRVRRISRDAAARKFGMEFALGAEPVPCNELARLEREANPEAFAQAWWLADEELDADQYAARTSYYAVAFERNVRLGLGLPDWLLTSEQRDARRLEPVVPERKPIDETIRRKRFELRKAKKPAKARAAEPPDPDAKKRRSEAAKARVERIYGWASPNPTPDQLAARERMAASRAAYWGPDKKAEQTPEQRARREAQSARYKMSKRARVGRPFGVATKSTSKV